MRIASLLASSTEILFGLGLGPQVVAVSHECDYPPQAVSLPRVTRTRIDPHADSRSIDHQVRALLEHGEPLYEIDLERLAHLAPDLIVTQAQCDVCAVRYQDVVDAVAREPRLRGARVVALNPQRLDDVLHDVLRVAEAAGCPQAGAAYVAALQERVQRVAARASSLPAAQRPTVVCLEWLAPLMAAGNWMPELVERAGGRNLLTTAGRHSPEVSWEAIRAAAPDVLLVMPCGFDLPRTLAELPLLCRHRGFDELPAVRHGRVYALDGNAYFNRSGPRMVDSLELVAHLLHPQDFPLPRPMVHAPAFRRWCVEDPPRSTAHRPA